MQCRSGDAWKVPGYRQEATISPGLSVTSDCLFAIYPYATTLTSKVSSLQNLIRAMSSTTNVEGIASTVRRYLAGLEHRLHIIEMEQEYHCQKVATPFSF